jgi:hypothetical protein
MAFTSQEITEMIHLRMQGHTRVSLPNGISYDLPPIEDLRKEREYVISRVEGSEIVIQQAAFGNCL